MIETIKSVTGDERDLIANLANTVAIIHTEKNYHWTGFYLIRDGELVLGPFQGPLACTRIAHGKGVCGTAWKEKKSQRVDDVHKFDGHIACSAATNSELVIPIIKNDEVVAVLDLDSVDYASFSEQDQKEYEDIANYLSQLF